MSCEADPNEGQSRFGSLDHRHPYRLTFSPLVWAQNYPKSQSRSWSHIRKAAPVRSLGSLIAPKLPPSWDSPSRWSTGAAASGATGTQSVARAAPDGYTLLLGQTGELVINRHLVRDLGYDPSGTFGQSRLVALIPLVLVVKADTPYRNPRRPPQGRPASKRGLTFSSGGPGTTAQFTGELLRLRSAVGSCTSRVTARRLRFAQCLTGRSTSISRPYRHRVAGRLRKGS